MEVHELLELAQRSGFVLSVIDALVMLAELAQRRSDGVTAARLAGAATAARERLGYRVLLMPHPTEADALARRVSAERPEAFAEGRGLDLDAAVEWARRMRGGRGRPGTGWDSLTPPRPR